MRTLVAVNPRTGLTPNLKRLGIITESQCQRLASTNQPVPQAAP
jgi:hypothetical protein